MGGVMLSCSHVSMGIPAIFCRNDSEWCVSFVQLLSDFLGDEYIYQIIIIVINYYYIYIHMRVCIYICVCAFIGIFLHHKLPASHRSTGVHHPTSTMSFLFRLSCGASNVAIQRLIWCFGLDCFTQCAIKWRAGGLTCYSQPYLAWWT